MAQWFGAGLALLAGILLARLAWEWHRYARGGHIITRRQMTLRIASAVDLVVLLVLVAIGARLDFASATWMVVYWAVCLGLALAAMIMALLDLRLLRRTIGRRRAERYRRLSEYIRRLEQGRGRQVP